MAVKVYQYPNCSTCRKAIAWLKARGVAFEAIDIVQAPPSAATLKQVAKLSGRPPQKLFNVSGQSYRAGGFKDKVARMDDAAIFEALAADGKLVKRPVVLGENVALVGFDEAAWAAAFG
jgi:arsenate reductase